VATGASRSTATTPIIGANLRCLPRPPIVSTPPCWPGARWATTSIWCSADWPWSSCRAHLGLEPAPAWLDAQALHASLLGRPVKRAADRRQAEALYADLVAQPIDAGFWSQGLRQQVFLGDEGFVERALQRTGASLAATHEVPRAQTSSPVAGVAQLMAQGLTREQALHRAYTDGGRTMTSLAAEVGLSVSRVSRLIAGVAPAVAKDKT
jgi:hypothetical protein